VVPDVVTMNNAHSTHWTANPDPRIPHVLRAGRRGAWRPITGLDLGEMLVRNVPTDLRGGWGDAGVRARKATRSSSSRRRAFASAILAICTTFPTPRSSPCHRAAGRGDGAGGWRLYAGPAQHDARWCAAALFGRGADALVLGRLAGAVPGRHGGGIRRGAAGGTARSTNCRCPDCPAARQSWCWNPNGCREPRPARARPRAGWRPRC
jgi:hypothetical protein